MIQNSSNKQDRGCIYTTKAGYELSYCIGEEVASISLWDAEPNALFSEYDMWVLFNVKQISSHLEYMVYVVNG